MLFVLVPSCSTFPSQPPRSLTALSEAVVKTNNSSREENAFKTIAWTCLHFGIGLSLYILLMYSQ